LVLQKHAIASALYKAVLLILLEFFLLMPSPNTPAAVMRVMIPLFWETGSIRAVLIAVPVAQILLPLP
jgi:hypothetical protein